MRALTRKLLRDVLRLRSQLLAITLVAACGVAVLVSMRTAGYALVATRDLYYERYRFADVFAHLKRAPERVARDIGAIPGVAAVDARIVVDVTIDVPGLDEPAAARVIGIPVSHRPLLDDVHIRRGRYLAAGAPNEVLVSESFAEANRLDVGDTIGAILNGRWQRLAIAGIALSPEYVFAVAPGALFPDNRRFAIIWMDGDALAGAFGLSGAFNDVAVALGRGGVERDVIAGIDRVLARYGGLGAYGRADQPSHRTLSDDQAQARIGAVFYPLIFLGVAAFLLHVVLSRLITLQRDQIAVLKAFGYRDAAIGAHYLGLAMLAILPGAALGIGIGTWLGHGLAVWHQRFYRFPMLRFDLHASVVVIAMAVSVGAAALGAIGALRRVLALPPAEAMRPEPPARFRRGVLERVGLDRAASPVFRMILRNIEHRPVVALISIFAIALATAILITGRSVFDAAWYMSDVQFRDAEREDATVIFDRPQPARARDEIAVIPGVLLAEPMRSVAARLVVGHHSRRVAILGLDSAGRLYRVIDRNRRPAPLPADGLMLSADLARRLGVRRGDAVTAEIQEGRRLVRRVAVTQTVEQDIGLGAFMSLDALDRLTGDGPTISGVLVRIDPLEERAAYAAFKRLPAVSSVSIRRATIASFDATMTESLRIVMSALIVFAGVIAFGVVYNAARIALSEHARELASLRVLGFTRREVAVILLGEQAGLTAVALALGCAIGYGFVATVFAAAATELFRLPAVIRPQTYGTAILVVLAAAGVSWMAVRRRLDRLDLVAVLKTRE
ncbi:MAG TPA: FtsX-like permease family protein [Candidatus Eisenbacteria bacterium]|nr:FtsX-like permease family protein [Candidatus Eisenbacteria bacterium]